MKYTVTVTVTMEVETDTPLQAASLACRQLHAEPLAGIGQMGILVDVITEDADIKQNSAPEYYPFPPNPDEHHSPHFSTYDKGSCMCNCPQCTEQYGAGNCICPWCCDSEHLHGAR